MRLLHQTLHAILVLASVLSSTAQCPANCESESLETIDSLLLMEVRGTPNQVTANEIETLENAFQAAFKCGKYRRLTNVKFLTDAIYSYVGNDVGDQEKTFSWLAKVEGTSRVCPSSLFSNTTEEVRRLEMDGTGLLRGAPPLKTKSLQSAEGHRKRSAQKEENSRQQIRGFKIQKENVEADDFPYNHHLIHPKTNQGLESKGRKQKVVFGLRVYTADHREFLDFLQRHPPRSHCHWNHLQHYRNY
jgi:hypothetical protein